jgi:Camelysin metallo-endopeptidase
MHRPHPTRLGRRTRRLAIIATIASSTAMVGAGAYTLALFTDSTASAGNAFVVGTLAIGVSPSSALITLSGMVPGDSTTGTLTVSSTGNSTLRYAMTTAATNPDGKALRDQMTLVVKTKDTNTAGCANFNGTQLFSGTLAAGAIGDPTQGAQGGDRTLAGGASEVLCFRAALPGSTGNAFAGAGTTATFTFSAEQTANNP